MYYCQKCNKLTQPGEKSNVMVIETRERVYTRKKGDKEFVVGHGTEIVKEIRVCGECRQNLSTTETTTQ